LTEFITEKKGNDRGRRRSSNLFEEMPTWNGPVNGEAMGGAPREALGSAARIYQKGVEESSSQCDRNRQFEGLFVLLQNVVSRKS